MADSLTPTKETAIVNHLEATLRNPEASSTSEMFQQQLGSLSHADQLQIINHINQDKQNEGYSSSNPLPQLTLHDDGAVTEKVAGNDSDLGVWSGSNGAKAGADLKAPQSYYDTVNRAGIVPAAQSFASDLTRDPVGAVEAAGKTVVDLANGTKDALVGPVKNEIHKIPGA